MGGGFGNVCQGSAEWALMECSIHAARAKNSLFIERNPPVLAELLRALLAEVRTPARNARAPLDEGDPVGHQQVGLRPGLAVAVTGIEIDPQQHRIG